MLGANDLQLKLSSRPDTALVVPGTKMQKRRNKKKNCFLKKEEEKKSKVASHRVDVRSVTAEGVRGTPAARSGHILGL